MLFLARSFQRAEPLYLFQAFNDGRTQNLRLGLRVTLRSNNNPQATGEITTSPTDDMAHTELIISVQFVIYFVAYSGRSIQLRKIINKLNKEVYNKVL